MGKTHLRTIYYRFEYGESASVRERNGLTG